MIGEWNEALTIVARRERKEAKSAEVDAGVDGTAEVINLRSMGYTVFRE